MKYLLFIIFCLTSLLSTNVFAGEYFYGSAYNKEDACKNAENRAEESARSKKTCYAQCDIRKCVKENDGTFTCKASSADNYGSCDGSMIKPK